MPFASFLLSFLQPFPTPNAHPSLQLCAPSVDNNTMFEQSKQHLSEYLTSNSLLDLSKHFRAISLRQIKDISCVEIYRDILYVGTNDSKVFAFDIDRKSDETSPLSLTNEKSFYPHCSSVYLIAASSLHLIVVPFAEQQLIRIWNRESLQILHGFKGHERQITKVIFLQDSRHLASTGYDGTVRVWDLSQKFMQDEETSKFVGRYPLLTLVEIDSETIAFAGDDCFITVWNWRRKAVRYRCFAHPGSVNGLVSCQPNYLFSIGGDSKIRVWRIAQREQRDQPSTEVLFTTDEIVSGGLDRRFQLIMVKQFDKKSTQMVHSVKVSNSEALIVDSKGNTYLMNRDLQIISSQFKLQYSETIRDVQFWRNELLVVICLKGRGELREINVDFEEVLIKEKAPERAMVSVVPMTVVQIGTRHSIELENTEQIKEVPRMVQDIEQQNF